MRIAASILPATLAAVMLGACADAKTLRVEFDTLQPDAVWESVFEAALEEGSPVTLHVCIGDGQAAMRTEAMTARPGETLLDAVRRMHIEADAASRDHLRSMASRLSSEEQAPPMPRAERNALAKAYLDSLRAGEAQLAVLESGAPIAHAAEVVGVDRARLREVAGEGARIVEPDRVFARWRVRNIYPPLASPCPASEGGGIPMDLARTDAQAREDLATLRRELGRRELGMDDE